ncbi:MAG: excinuclease ABC subunit UvrA [Chloroflexi bacterium]|nr:excinuclease ABC subunit UvrA [Chloroflexota bacterium]
MQDTITIRSARLHNLKNITLSIPKNKLVVFPGLSGSGKSTLAFDTLHNEGQRQFMESLGLVTWALSKPQVDAIEGLSPSISVDQHLTNHSPRSTVGTVTEVFTYLRILYARLGHRPCPSCGADVPPSHDVNGSEIWDDESAGNGVSDSALDVETFPCPNCGKPIPEIGMANFSFNKPAGACPTCTGLGTVIQPNLPALVNSDLSIVDGAVNGWDKVYLIPRNSETLKQAGKHFGFDFDPNLPVKQLGELQRDLLFYGVASPQFRRHFPNVKLPDTVSRGYFEGVVTSLMRRYADHIGDPSYREKMGKLLSEQTCPDCQGTRLSQASRQVLIIGQSIIDLSRLPLTELANWLNRLKEILSAEEWMIAEPIAADLRDRVRRLVDVGVGYLTMERSSPTLSAGEAQRLRLAALLGSGLTGVLYVLDEPTIGLHPRDTDRLIRVFKQLRDLGNTVLVIEHDLQVLRSADHVVDIGPGAGKHGGRIVVSGSPDEVAACGDSITGDYMSGRQSVNPPRERRTGNGHHLVISGAREHNLKDLTVKLPLGMLIAITGVSGSGKSSLAFDILDRAARQRFYNASDIPGVHDKIEGWEYIGKVVTIDQSAIQRSPRSNAATYTDAFGPIRETFAALPSAKERGMTARHFSFNVPGGRCERCEGSGVLSVEMHFLPDVQVRCPTCHGRRFKREVLAVEYNGYNVAQVLDLTIEEALNVFQDVPAVASRLGLMTQVGLGYLQLGQPATTLSGGEAQRVKLAKELGRRAVGHTLYLLDEPTTGLHVADTAKLLVFLQQLVDAGNTVTVVEHNLDVMRAADWVIDLGPEGGAAGGEIIAEGTPEDIARSPKSLTGKFLAM